MIWFDFFKIELVPQFAYVEDQCAVTKNCVENAECVDKKCKCNSGYTLKNGACCMLKISSMFYNTIKSLI